MVCDRCIISVKDVFNRHGLYPQHITLGEVHLNESVDSISIANIGNDLNKIGFEIVDSSTPILIVKIKSALIELFNKKEIPEEFKLSNYLTQRFPYDYSHLSRIFSQHEEDTIEHYLIKLRIEKAKELLTYRDLNISQVAYKLGYASAAHFSRQFKKIVGVTPSNYIDNPAGRQSLEDI